MAKSDFDGAKKDKMMDRRKARKIKMAQQEESYAPEEQGYSSGGKVRGMGAAQRGGKYCIG